MTTMNFTSFITGYVGIELISLERFQMREWIFERIWGT